MTKIESIKIHVAKWSGFPLDGETKEEMIKSLDTISYQLQCEISDRAAKFERRIKEL